MTYKHTYGEVHIGGEIIALYLDGFPEFRQIMIDEQHSHILTPLAELNRLSEIGWEVYAVTTNAEGIMIYHVKKESALHGI